MIIRQAHTRDPQALQHPHVQHALDSSHETIKHLIHTHYPHLPYVLRALSCAKSLITHNLHTIQKHNQTKQIHTLNNQPTLHPTTHYTNSINNLPTPYTVNLSLASAKSQQPKISHKPKHPRTRQQRHKHTPTATQHSSRTTVNHNTPTQVTTHNISHSTSPFSPGILALAVSRPTSQPCLTSLNSTNQKCPHSFPLDYPLSLSLSPSPPDPSGSAG
eukprot:2947763-Rhodomonas_salina.4